MFLLEVVLLSLKKHYGSGSELSSRNRRAICVKDTFPVNILKKVGQDMYRDHYLRKLLCEAFQIPGSFPTIFQLLEELCFLLWCDMQQQQSWIAHTASVTKDVLKCFITFQAYINKCSGWSE